MKNSINAYRMSAVEGATHLDVLLGCYDALAEDVRLAGVAAENGDIAARCRYSQHATLLLGHLESWIPFLENVSLEESLVRFYAYVRNDLLRLQSSSASSGFTDLAMRVCETRAVWQQKNNMLLSADLKTPVELPSNVEDSQSGARLCCLA